jgi:hypothetical protein
MAVRNRVSRAANTPSAVSIPADRSISAGEGFRE